MRSGFWLTSADLPIVRHQVEAHELLMLPTIYNELPCVLAETATYILQDCSRYTYMTVE